LGDEEPLNILRDPNLNQEVKVQLYRFGSFSVIDPGTNEIVVRQYGQFNNHKPEEVIKFIGLITAGYPLGAPIVSGGDGYIKTLQGMHVLEVPPQGEYDPRINSVARKFGV
jgi:hypothetical protein